MNKPSKAAAVLSVLFGMVFLAVGLFIGWALLFAPPGSVHGNRAVGVVACAIFVAIGGALPTSAVYGTRKLGQQAALEQSNPDSPWLWRKDWAASRAYGNDSKKAIGLALFASLWNLIAISVAAAAIPQFLRTSDTKYLGPLLFVAVGVVLAFQAVRAAVRRERFGQTYFHFASLPFSPGKPLRGSIHLRFNTTTRHGINLRLSCVRQIVAGGQENRSTNKVVLWQSDKNVSEQSITPGAVGDAAIPVDFNIPSDAYETNHDQPRDQLLWILHAEADTPGVSFSDDFEVPVFRLTPQPQAAGSFGDSDAATVSAGFESDSEDVLPPNNPKVVVGAGANGGTEYYFPALRSPARIGIATLIAAGWTFLVYFLGHSQAPIFFTIVFGLFDLLPIYILVKSLAQSFCIEAGNGKLVFRRAWVGIGTTVEIPYSDIAQILCATTGQSTPPTYSLRLQTKSGQKITLADLIDDRQEARWVAAQLEKLVGLKLDTHVQVDMGLGSYGRPPQRGMASPQASPPARVALALGIAILSGLFAFGFLIRSSSGKNTAPRRGTTRRVTTMKSPVQSVDYSALTDSDVQRLQGMPEQAQAEELLERAIRHDSRALDLFEQSIGIWLGDIKLTEHMKQLEWRSRFSTDLRVRYANADLNLAMDGWSKSDNSVDLLIAKAKTDPGYRQAAVYFMGMMAGRGVGYARIYPVLVEYARSDPDANVRQWAVEGMRYLGTDEALDVLFESFTHDPSDTVRDRAGCNISDCGNFMRKQRMRMVPKFIDLTEDPRTTPVMRSWSFMALREITDESLAADASAWRNWYTQHGDEKMAEFEKMDWWKVRGDE
ncbi:MAG TPA: HEAT repeat domain-containing protein [Terriglobales bacterium]|nr:HEAT repeat domain-containing protein [Terriglobales bacterium]